MYPIVEPRQRPERFLLNRFSPLAESAAFLGLGGFDAAGSVWYPDARRLLGAVPNDGTLTNMDPATDWSRNFGRAVVDLAGDNDCITMPTLPTVVGISAWVYTADWSGHGQLFNSTASAASAGLYNTPSDSVLFNFGGVRKGFANPSTDGTWHHIAGTTVGGTVYGWLDDAAQSMSINNAWDLRGGAYIGCRGGNENFLAGSLADVILTRTPLTNSMVSALADPSNVMLEVGGVPLILPPHRVSFPAAVAVGGFKPYWLRPSSQIIGGGIAA